LLKYKTVLGKLAGRIGTFPGPDLARGPDFGDRWFYPNVTIQITVKHSTKTDIAKLH